MTVLERYQKAFLANPKMAAEAEAERERKRAVRLKNGARDEAVCNDITELFIRVQGEKEGFCSTQDLEKAPEEILEKAYESSEYAKEEITPMHSPDSCYQGEKEAEPGGTAFEELWKCAELLEHDFFREGKGIRERTVQIEELIRTISLVNTKGCDLQCSSKTYLVTLQAFDADGTGESWQQEISTAKLSDISFAHFREPFAFWKNRVTADKPFVSGNYRCILGRKAVLNLLLIFWQMFSSVEKQNRNTPFLEQTGKRIASKEVTLTDRACRPDTGFRFPFDCEGSRCEDVTVIENGVFQVWLQKLSASPQTGHTGHAGRKPLLSPGDEVVVTPHNLCLEPGKWSFGEMLGKLGDGLYLYESYDIFHSIHLPSGQFSVAGNGFVVKDGVICGAVKGATVQGTIQDLLMQVEAVGNELEWKTMINVKSYIVGAPDLLISRMKVRC